MQVAVQVEVLVAWLQVEVLVEVLVAWLQVEVLVEVVLVVWSVPQLSLLLLCLLVFLGGHLLMVE